MWFADLDTETISDTGSSTTVLVVTLVLVAFGVGLSAVTAWFWRQTAPDPDALGPLAVMSRRRFASLGAIEQRRLMDEARPGFVAAAESNGVSSDDSESAEPVDPDEAPVSASSDAGPDSRDVVDEVPELLDDPFDDPLDDDFVHEAFEVSSMSDEPSDVSAGEEPEHERPQRFIDPLLGR